MLEMPELEPSLVGKNLRIARDFRVQVARIDEFFIDPTQEKQDGALQAQKELKRVLLEYGNISREVESAKHSQT